MTAGARGEREKRKSPMTSNVRCHSRRLRSGGSTAVRAAGPEPAAMVEAFPRSAIFKKPLFPSPRLVSHELDVMHAQSSHPSDPFRPNKALEPTPGAAQCSQDQWYSS